MKSGYYKMLGPDGNGVHVFTDKIRKGFCSCTAGGFCSVNFKGHARGYVITNEGYIPNCPVCGYGIFGFLKGNLAYNLKNNLKEEYKTKEKKNAPRSATSKHAQP